MVIKINPRKLWRNIQKILPGKSNHQLPNDIVFEGVLEKNLIIFANKFNHYFVDSIQALLSNIESAIPNDESVEGNEVLVQHFLIRFRPTTMSQLKQIVRNMKNTSGSVDGIKIKILKDSRDVIANRYLDVISTSFLLVYFRMSGRCQREN